MRHQAPWCTFLTCLLVCCQLVHEGGSRSSFPSCLRAGAVHIYHLCHAAWLPNLLSPPPCHHYLRPCSKAMADKATAADASFLLLLFSCGKAAVPLCYEAHVSLEDGAVPLQAHQFSTTWHPEQTTEASACRAEPRPGFALPGCPVMLTQRAAAPRPESNCGGSGGSGMWQAGAEAQQACQLLPMPSQAAHMMVPPPLLQLCYTPPAPTLPGPASYGKLLPQSGVALAQLQEGAEVPSPAASVFEAASQDAAARQVPVDQASAGDHARVGRNELSAPSMVGDTDARLHHHSSSHAEQLDGRSHTRGAQSISSCRQRREEPTQEQCGPALAPVGSQAEREQSTPMSQPSLEVPPQPSASGGGSSSAAKEGAASSGGGSRSSPAASALLSADASLSGNELMDGGSLPSLAGWGASSCMLPQPQLQPSIAGMLSGGPLAASSAAAASLFPSPQAAAQGGLSALQQQPCQPQSQVYHGHLPDADASGQGLPAAVHGCPAQHNSTTAAVSWSAPGLLLSTHPAASAWPAQQPCATADVALLCQEVALLRQEVGGSVVEAGLVAARLCVGGAFAIASAKTCV